MRELSVFRRFGIAVFILWILASTNPDASSLRRSLLYRSQGGSTTSPFRQLAPPVSALLARVFETPRKITSLDGDTASAQPLILDGIDCALFTLAVAGGARDHHVAYIGILGTWLPVPGLGALFLPPHARMARLRIVMRGVLSAAAELAAAAPMDGLGGGARATVNPLPARPWEWLVAGFAAAGAFWLVCPGAAGRHLTLTWENARTAGRWWTLALFHVSHGGSVLRLTRTVAACNYLAPRLLAMRVVTLSGLYGVVLTGCAMSTALGMLVLARRNVFGARGAPGRSALEINGGGGCVYALLVAACLNGGGAKLQSSANAAFGMSPFELLMLNIAFDAVFLAGQKRIADYTAHTGAALGAWLYCSLSQFK
jgi:hypothetical protein